MADSNIAHVEKALKLATDHFNTSQTDFVKNRITHLKPDAFYVLSTSKILGNWKVFLGTKLVNGLIYEVTYDGNRHQTYLDVYVRMSNVIVPDATVGDIFNKENN